ncbi:hypothetical protein F8388_005733 [Cannabis sativa]|uniref:Piwi domain-containing protein n=1 Tax=Cannabis sativa TaxID=3483 RepID=A0A7J6EPM9_CANSA|nr:hypothetical protein F8388_005733 [Cannabis sativa]
MEYDEQGDLERICETDLVLMSQCCLTKHFFKISKQYLANVSLKINVKGFSSYQEVGTDDQRSPAVYERTKEHNAVTFRWSLTCFTRVALKNI